LKTSKLVQWANENDMFVQPWSYRNDIHSYSADPLLEYKIGYRLGVHTFFTDFTDTAIDGIYMAKQSEKWRNNKNKALGFLEEWL